MIGLGYYHRVKLYREWIRRGREERLADGLLMVLVRTDHSRLPEGGIVVHNFREYETRLHEHCGRPLYWVCRPAPSRTISRFLGVEDVEIGS